MNTTEESIKRNIPRLVECPKLNQGQINIISQICFREDDPIQNANCLFVFGTGKYVRSAVEKMTEILDSGVVKTVILTGGIPNYEDSRKDIPKAEARLLLEAINPERYPNVTFILDEKSNNTVENVRLGVEEAKKQNVNLDKIIFLFKSQVAGRGYATLRKYLPNTTLLQQTFTPPYDGTLVINKDNWFETQEGRDRLWGEILRLRRYGGEGDIDTSEIKDLLEKLPE